MEEKELPEYEAPEVISYTDKEILALLGPARTGSPVAAGENLISQ